MYGGLLKKSHCDGGDCRAILRIARNDLKTHLVSLREAQRRSNLSFFNSPYGTDELCLIMIGFDR